MTLVDALAFPVGIGFLFIFYSWAFGKLMEHATYSNVKPDEDPNA